MYGHIGCFMYVYIHTSLYIYIYTYTYTCIYIYMYIYIYIHTYVHTYAYSHRATIYNRNIIRQSESEHYGHYVKYVHILAVELIGMGSET